MRPNSSTSSSRLSASSTCHGSRPSLQSSPSISSLDEDELLLELLLDDELLLLDEDEKLLLDDELLELDDSSQQLQSQSQLQSPDESPQQLQLLDDELLELLLLELDDEDELLDESESSLMVGDDVELDESSSPFTAARIAATVAGSS